MTTKAMPRRGRKRARNSGGSPPKKRNKRKMGASPAWKARNETERALAAGFVQGESKAIAEDLSVLAPGGNNAVAGPTTEESPRKQATQTTQGSPKKLSPNQKRKARAERARRAKEMATEAATVLTSIKEDVPNPGKEATVATGQKTTEAIVHATKTKRGEASDNNEGLGLTKEGSKSLAGNVETQDGAEGKMMESPKSRKAQNPKEDYKSESAGEESDESDGTSKAGMRDMDGKDSPEEEDENEKEVGEVRRSGRLQKKKDEQLTLAGK